MRVIHGFVTVVKNAVELNRITRVQFMTLMRQVENEMAGQNPADLVVVSVNLRPFGLSASRGAAHQTTDVAIAYLAEMDAMVRVLGSGQPLRAA